MLLISGRDLSLVDGLRFEEDAQLSNDEGALKIGNIGIVSWAYCWVPDPSINKQKNLDKPMMISTV